jgi:putative membrane protein
MMWGYPGYGDGGSWIAMGIMMLFGLLFLAGLVLLVVWLVRSSSHGAGPYDRGHGSGTDRACDIAKERFARGEITREQYDDICRTVRT